MNVHKKDIKQGNEIEDQDRTEKKAWNQAYFRNGFYCLIIFLILALSAIPLMGCNDKERQIDIAAVSAIQETIPKPDEEFTILATGDIMMHDTMLNAGWQAGTKSFDYTYMFEQVAPILQQGDLVIGNLEVPLAGAAAKYSGYPMFNAPEILAENLKDAGFDFVTTANNHCLDRRYNGLVSTLNFLDAAGIMHTGTARSTEEQAKTVSVTIKGVKIAFVSATYGTNGMKLPEGKEYAVNYLDQTALLNQIKKARNEGAQYVIAMLHWGQEYEATPNSAQTALANALLAGGADLILGNHPHVLQPGEIVTAPAATKAVKADSGEAIQTKFVMYSMGNFISSQKGLERVSSLILKVTVGVDGTTGIPYFKAASYIPLYTQKKNKDGDYHFIVWPIEQAKAAAQKPNYPFSFEDKAALTKAWDHVLTSQPAMSPLPMREALSEDLPSQ